MTLINEAVPLYLGYELDPFPKEDASRLVSKFGVERGNELESQVKMLLNELIKLKPDWNAHTLVTASRWAVAELRQVHPELDNRSIAALEWVYSWWWK